MVARFSWIPPHSCGFLSRALLERQPVSGDGFLEPRRAGFPLSDQSERAGEGVLGPRPRVRFALARTLLECEAEGRDGFLEPCRAGLPLTQRPKCGSEAVLYAGPPERILVACADSEDTAVDGDCLVEACRIDLADAQHLQRHTKTCLRKSPVEWCGCSIAKAVGVSQHVDRPQQRIVVSQLVSLLEQRVRLRCEIPELRVRIEVDERCCLSEFLRGCRVEQSELIDPGLTGQERGLFTRPVTPGSL